MAKRFLVIDDAIFMRMKLKTLLAQAGHEVVGEGGNGLEAVAKFTELRPDVVLMDITMPEMDGIAALKEIRKIDPKAVVVMVSAVGQDRSVKEAVISGARNFIIKPFADEKFQEMLAKL